MVKIEQSLCIGCAKCVKDCVSGVLHIDQGKAAVRESCMQCGHCVAVCPVKAVSIPEYDMADVAEYDKDSFTYTPECFLNAVKFRRSIRSYKDRRVEREQLLGLIEAGPFVERHQTLAAGVDWMDYDVVIVKTGYAFPEPTQQGALCVMSLTDGATLQDTRRLPFKRIMRPMFPIDDI